MIFLKGVLRAPFKKIIHETNNAQIYYGVGLWMNR